MVVTFLIFFYATITLPWFRSQPRNFLEDDFYLYSIFILLNMSYKDIKKKERKFWKLISSNTRVCSKKKGKKVLDHRDLSFWRRKKCYTSKERKILSAFQRYASHFSILCSSGIVIEIVQEDSFQKTKFSKLFKNLSINLVDRYASFYS